VAWFDYLDLRINGAEFHRALLRGEHRFDGPEVRAVFAEFAKVVPYFHPSSRSYAYQEAITPFARGDAAMYLMGALITDVLPDDVDDLDFFQFPILDPSLPTPEEAPTNGFIAPARVRDPDATRDFLAFLGSDEAQVIYCRDSQSSSVPTSPSADTSWTTDLVKKGLNLLNGAHDLTQFFNRDSSEELQQTAYTACTRFLAEPGEVNAILADWQTAAEAIWQDQGT
jgi:multiple sugar transport system substrate-binding protein